MLSQKKESSLEKNSFTKRSFLKDIGNPVRKRKVCNIKVVMQNSAIKGYNEFYCKVT